MAAAGSVAPLQQRRPGSARVRLLRVLVTVAIVCLLFCADADAARARRPRRAKRRERRSVAAGLPPPHASEAPVAAAVVRVHVARPLEFDPRLQAAFATGLMSQLATGGRTAWVAAAGHTAVAAGPAATRHLLQPSGAGGTRYLITLVVKADSLPDALDARDALVESLNKVGVCALHMNGGLTGLCDYAAEYAEIDEFNPATALTVESTSASPTEVPGPASTASIPPACRAVGETCDGAASACCGWGMGECDLRPGAPTWGTCRSLTGPGGPSCSKQGSTCSSDYDCCPYLKCAAEGPGGQDKRCTWTPEHGALSLNVTVRGNFSTEAQSGLMSAVRYWLLREGSGAMLAKVVSYEPLAIPDPAVWAANPTYRYELLVGAPTHAALSAALRTSLRSLGGSNSSSSSSSSGSGSSGSSGAGHASKSSGDDGELCRVPVSSVGKGETVCSLAKARCSDKLQGKPCSLEVVASSVSAVARVDASYKNPSCKKEGAACGGPFDVAGECCDGQMCTMGVPGDKPSLQTGVCRPKCAEKLKVCSKDSECCSYWGAQYCNPQLGICLPKSMNITEFAYSH